MTRLLCVLAIFALVGAYTPVAGAAHHEEAAAEATDGADDVAAPANPCGETDSAEDTDAEAPAAATDEEEVPAAPKPE